MYLIYKQDYYKDKQEEINDHFIEYLFLIMDNLDHPVLIEEWGGNVHADAYEKNLNQDVKIPSTKETIDCYDKTEKWPTSKK